MEARLIGRYRLNEQIGSGSLSTVYSATDTSSNQHVALKLAKLPVSPGARDGFIELFRQEIALVSRLQHPAAANVLGQGNDEDGSPYFVMEFVEGLPLDVLLKQETKLSAAVAVSVARQVASALGAAHALGFLHRDVKPANILVLTDPSLDPWTIKLLDFGVAAELNTETRLTQGGGLFGSVNYMSPEQIAGKPLSPASDVWQLGVTLFEMLTGALPFTGTSTIETMSAILRADPAGHLSANVPAPLQGFLLRSLAKNPADRFRTGAEASMRLAELQGAFSSGALPPVPARAEDQDPFEFSTASESEGPQVDTRSAWTGGSAPPLPMPPPVSAAEPPPFRRMASNVQPGAITSVSFAAPSTGVSASARTVSVAAIALFGFSLLVLTLAVVVVSHGRSVHPFGPWVGVALGICIVVAGVVFSRVISRTLAARADVLAGEAHQMLASARNREHLSQTLAIQVDTIAARCRLADEKFMAMTMAVMVDEYGSATTLDERQKSLMNAVTLLEKLTAKLTPWYVRQEKLIALGVTLIGIISGLLTIAMNTRKLLGKP